MRAALLVIFSGLVSLGPLQAPSYVGRPTFSAANSAGYYLWQDNGVWHLRWVSLDRARRFEGQVTINEGTIRLLSKIDPGAEMSELFRGREDRRPFVVVNSAVDAATREMTAPRPKFAVRKKGQSTVTFDSEPDNSLDGIDFIVRGNATSIWLELKLDRKSSPSIVWIGQNNSHPEESPFILPLK